MKNIKTDVLIIGGGPAGLAAAVSAHDAGAEVLLIEREKNLGGILKQCIHDGFGLERFGERLTGPEYAQKYMDMFFEREIKFITGCSVTDMFECEKTGGSGFLIKAVTEDGIAEIKARAVVLATGCRERTSRQVFIHGTRPAGIFTAGAAQNMINLKGEFPARKCVILGSGDIGLIMARRLTIEGAKVLGVYEIKNEPSGLTRNIAQCLDDFDIPLHLSTTVTRVFGRDRVEAVEVAKVDDAMRQIEGTEEIIECDALILSVGLIPENELAEKLGISLDPRTKGPFVDENHMTSVSGVFSCGNAMNVHDLVDHVSAGAEDAGKNAAVFARGETNMECSRVLIKCGKGVACFVPQLIDTKHNGKVSCYFRSARSLEASRLVLMSAGRKMFVKKYPHLRPPEMQKVDIDFSEIGKENGSEIEAIIELL